MNEKVKKQGFDVAPYTVAVVGCGGLGTNAAVHLAGAGVGRLLLCDFDTVQQSNLNRQFFYTPQDTGQKKAALLGKRLRDFAPDVAVDVFDKKITVPEDLAFTERADLLIAAVDNADARRVICDWCRQSGKPYINGGVDGAFGTVYLCVPGKTPDLEAAGGLLQSTQAPLAQSPTVGIIGALQAKLAVDFLCGDHSSQGKLFCFDGNTIQTLSLK